MWLIKVKGKIEDYDTIYFGMKRDAMLYFKKMRMALDNQKYHITSIAITDKENPDNIAYVTTLKDEFKMSDKDKEDALHAIYFDDEPYKDLLDKAMDYIERKGYSVDYIIDTFTVNIRFKIVYLGLAELFIHSFDNHMTEESIMMKHKTYEEIAHEILDIMDKSLKNDNPF